MDFEAWLDSLKNKTVAVIGIGVSNRPLVELLLSRGVDVTACDRKSREALGAVGDELEAKGFIKVYSGKATREPNLYEFCYDWKIAPRPRACAPPLAISSKSDSK